MNTVKEKSMAILSELFTKCSKEHKNQYLEALFEPDTTSSQITTDSSLILGNLKNIHSRAEKGQPIYFLK